MKIHIVVPVFPPESIASAVMAEHLASSLARLGHEVTVITSFPSKMKGEIYQGYSRKLYQLRIDSAGYSLLRVFSFFSKRSSITSRVPEYLSYALTSNLGSLIIGKPDVVFMNTWPIATFLTSFFCKLRKVPYVFNVQDLYPESAGGLGYLKESGLLYKLFLQMDRFSMKNAAHIIPISEEFSATIQRSRGISSEKIKVVWNWYDGQVSPESKIGIWRQKISRDNNKFIAMYAGNIGSVAGLEVVLEAAKLLASKKEYVFVLAGDGTLRENFEYQCQRQNINNVIFIHPLTKNNLSQIHAAADIMLITAKPGLARSEVPSKMMAYMLSGRPILAMVDNDSNTARLVNLASCGLNGEPGNPEALVKNIIQMHQSSLLDKWGENARSFALEHFDQKKNVAAIVKVLEQVANASESEF